VRTESGTGRRPHICLAKRDGSRLEDSLIGYSRVVLIRVLLGGPILTGIEWILYQIARVQFPWGGVKFVFQPAF
jgi:hypothetical protein